MAQLPYFLPKRLFWGHSCSLNILLEGVVVFRVFLSYTFSIPLHLPSSSRPSRSSSHLVHIVHTSIHSSTILSDLVRPHHLLLVWHLLRP